MEGSALGFVADRETELLDLCRDLVAARSENPPGCTVEAALVVECFLARYGVACERVARDLAKPNLVATVEGGGGAGPHLVLNGHLDTLHPGEGAGWTVPPFAPTERNGRLFGLGMGNMKGGLAALALAFAWLATERQRWRGRVSFTAVADETVFGPDGAAFLLDARPGLRGDALLCGEGPGSMELASTEKGLLWVAAEATGRPAQGMLAARGASPIARLAAFLVEVDRLNEVTAEPPASAGPLDPGEGGHGLRLSANLGTVQGGRFVSQAAERAVAEIDLRLPPGLTLAEVEAHLAVPASVHGVTLRRVKGWDPNWTPPTAAIARAVTAAATRVRACPPRLVVRLPASDASRWRALGVPAVCFGPQPGLAAGVDDHALARDVADCARIYALAAWSYLSGA